MHIRSAKIDEVRNVNSFSPVLTQSGTMDNALETSGQRIHHCFRQTLAQRRKLLPL